MNKIFAIALNTFREAVRNRVLYILLFFAVIVLLGGWVASTLSIEDESRIVRNFGTAAINLIAGLIAVFVGIGLVYNDLDKKTIYTIVAKPISRWQFIVGKYLGLLLTIFVNVVVMTFVLCVVIHLRDAFDEETLRQALIYQDDTGVHTKGIGAQAWYYVSSVIGALGQGLATVFTLGFYSPGRTGGLFLGSMLTMLEMSIIVAFAVLFSSFSSPILSAFMTAIVWVIGKMNRDLWELLEAILRRVGDVQNLQGGDLVAYYFAYGMSHIAPNLSVFNQREAIAYNQAVTLDAYAVIYGVVYAACVLVLSVMIFERRNFK